jgi:hypothetical protein
MKPGTTRFTPDFGRHPSCAAETAPPSRRSRWGHAVRQLYLLAGVADVYVETADASLLQALVITNLQRSSMHPVRWAEYRHAAAPTLLEER